MCVSTHVRAIVRNEGKGRAWVAQGCELGLANMNDRAALTNAFTGADAVFILPPPEVDPEPGYPEAQAVILRPAWFLDNVSWDVASACETGLIHSFLQPMDRPFPVVAAKDVGRVAADLIQEDWGWRRVIELEVPIASRQTPSPRVQRRLD